MGHVVARQAAVSPARISNLLNSLPFLDTKNPPVATDRTMTR